MTKKKNNTFAALVEARQLAEKIFLHQYRCGQIAETANPGQFVMLRVQESSHPFLPRPFSIAGVDESKETFSILFKICGEGTRLLAEKSVGNQIAVFGPLGKEFVIEPRLPNHTIVAAGMGIAPLLFLLRHLNSLSLPVRLIFAAGSRERICLKGEIEKLVDSLIFITEDGSLGEKGIATDLVGKYLNPEDGVYACGPKGFTDKFIPIAREIGLKNCQISLEEQMACGVGTCLGCVTKTADGYKRVCADGPVFPISILQ